MSAITCTAAPTKLLPGNWSSHHRQQQAAWPNPVILTSGPSSGASALRAAARGLPLTVPRLQPRRQRQPGGKHRLRGRLQVAASLAGEPSLLTLPVFPLPNVLHPTQSGVLTVFESRYVALFGAMLQEFPGGKGGRFVHVLSPATAPPALLGDTVAGLPRIGCCVEVQSIQENPDGTLRVQYCGTRRLQLLMAVQQEPYVVAAAEWYDDAESASLDPTVDVLESEAAKMLRQIQWLSSVVTPGSSLPAAVLRYAPPALQKQTSYDALKAAGHQAAGHIDTWRRHGSVYKTQHQPAGAVADPYAAIGEALGKGRRQELYSFAAAQLLIMGTPERTALLLSQDTGARLNFLLAALQPYLLELQAKASLKKQGLQ